LCKNVAVHHSKNCALMSQMGHDRSFCDVRRTTALAPKPEVHPRSCDVAQVP
jgi:hypothetical protein